MRVMSTRVSVVVMITSRLRVEMLVEMSRQSTSPNAIGPRISPAKYWKASYLVETKKGRQQRKRETKSSPNRATKREMQIIGSS